MAGERALDLMLQIRSLVSDGLQVISYKWLSRNFSVSSNNAKRLLQEFVEKNGNDLEVVYTISGWLKTNPKTYCVKLSSAPKIEETRKEFEGECSVQVYSVQSSIPKDPAILWNCEFVQAEELFNQPPSLDNCLRNNRFCGVSNSFVKRTSNGKYTSLVPPKPISSSVGVTSQVKTNSIQKEQAIIPPKQEQKPSPNVGPSEVNKNTRENTTKSKGQNGKSTSGNSNSNTGSLASMWGRASAKPKPAIGSPGIAGTSDAQICAKEETNCTNTDEELEELEEENINYKREDKTGGNNRKRRVIFDFSDEDEIDDDVSNDEEKVMSLASPEAPKMTKSLVQDDKNLDKVGEIANDDNNNNNNNNNNSNNNDKNNNNNGPGSPKRRKVLKTRIDDRGREVTEVVWEGESSPSDAKTKPNQDSTTNGTSNRPVPSKTPVASNNDRSSNNNNNNTVNSKTGGSKKPAKATGKETKQGNILSFFKKI